MPGLLTVIFLRTKVYKKLNYLVHDFYWLTIGAGLRWVTFLVFDGLTYLWASLWLAGPGWSKMASPGTSWLYSMWSLIIHLTSPVLFTRQGHGFCEQKCASIGALGSKVGWPHFPYTLLIKTSHKSSPYLKQRWNGLHISRGRTTKS